MQGNITANCHSLDAAASCRVSVPENLDGFATLPRDRCRDDPGGRRRRRQVDVRAPRRGDGDLRRHARRRPEGRGDLRRHADHQAPRERRDVGGRLRARPDVLQRVHRLQRPGQAVAAAGQPHGGAVVDAGARAEPRQLRAEVRRLCDRGGLAARGAGARARSRLDTLFDRGDRGGRGAAAAGAGAGRDAGGTRPLWRLSSSMRRSRCRRSSSARSASSCDLALEVSPRRASLAARRCSDRPLRASASCFRSASRLAIRSRSMAWFRATMFSGQHAALDLQAFKFCFYLKCKLPAAWRFGAAHCAE